MERMNREKYVKYVMLVCVVMAALIFVYIHQLNREITSNIHANIDEIAEHDVASIESYITGSWTDLDSICRRFQSSHCQTMTEIEERLNLECAAGRFQHLYLVASDGRVYTDKYFAYEADHFSFLSYFEDGKERVIANFSDAVNFTNIRREMTLYGVKIDDLEIEGVHLAALMGVGALSEMQEHLNFSTFGGQGYGNLIDAGGDYLVNANKGNFTSKRHNLYRVLENGTIKGGETPDSVKKRIQNQESFQIGYIDEKGTDKVVSFQPVADTGLYFFMIVPREVFTKKIQSFVVMNVGMLVIALLLMFLLLEKSDKYRREMQKAEAESKVKSDFLSNMSHEIRTPLNGLIGLNHLMMMHADDKAQLVDYLKKSQSTANYLLSLVNDILDMSKLQVEKVTLENAPLEIGALLDEVVSMQLYDMKNKGIDFQMEKEISVPYIVGDDIRIKQVLMNILGNAGKFTGKGGYVRLSVTQQKESETQVTTRIVCEDSGCGMSQKFLEHIWEPFYQERNKISRSVKGTGLGLAISHMLVEAMGGELTVESEEGKGSLFRIVLHSEIAEEIAHDAAERTGKRRGGAQAERVVKILVAEDNELNAEILCEILKDAGFEVAHAANGREAVELFAASGENEFSVILMDMQMPVLDGCAASKEIRKLERADAGSVFIFACTANTFQEDKEQALASGMNDFLAKPIDVGTLAKKIKRVV